MLVLRLVDVIHDRRHRRALPGPGHAAHQDHPALRGGDGREDRGQVQRIERRDVERDDAQHDHERRALPQDVHPEAADAGHTPRAVVVAQPVQPRPVLLVGDQVLGDRPRLLGREALLREGHQLAVHPRPEHVASLDVQVRSAAVDGGLDDLLDAPRLRHGPARARALGLLLH